MLTPREKSLLLEKFSPEEDQARDAASSRTLSPTHYQQITPCPPPPPPLPSSLWIPCSSWSQCIPPEHLSSNSDTCSTTLQSRLPCLTSLLPVDHSLHELGEGPVCSSLAYGTAHALCIVALISQRNLVVACLFEGRDHWPPLYGHIQVAKLWDPSLMVTDLVHR